MLHLLGANPAQHTIPVYFYEAINVTWGFILGQSIENEAINILGAKLNALLLVLLEVELQSEHSVGFPLRALLGCCHSSPSSCSVHLWECCLNSVSHPEERGISEAMGVSRTKKTKDSSSRWAPWWGLGFYVVAASSSRQLINCPFGECFFSGKIMQCSCMLWVIVTKAFAERLASMG